MADERVRDVLRSIDDDTPVDWAALESETSGEALRTARPSLEIVARIASFHRALHASARAPAQGTEFAPDEKEPGPVPWGPLEILEHLGSGSFGDVYRAWDRRLDREVALKLLRDAATSGPEISIVEEGRQLARVHHPNVVTVHGADIVDGTVGLWMEFVRGRTLAAMVREGARFDWRDAAAVGIDVCRALQAVHAAGLVHRDVNAQNVMRDESGRVVLMDFGAAHRLADEGGRARVAGTPVYLAPELCEGSPATRASDIYAVGVLLQFLVSGSYPVMGASLDEIRVSHRAGRRVRLGDVHRDLPTAFLAAVEAALDPDPSRRHASAAEMESALSAAVQPAQAEGGRRPGVWAMAGAGIAAAIGLAILAGVQSRLFPPPGAPSSETRGGTPAVSTVVTRRVPLPDSPYPSRPSLDGRYLPFVDRDRNVAVLELDSGTVRPLTETRASGEFAYGPTIVSPDSRWIAYTWALPDRTAALRAVDLESGSTRTLWPHEGGADLQPVEWSGDGRTILVMGPTREGLVQLALVDVDAGDLRVLKNLRFRPQGASLSPDGRFIAYDRSEHERGALRDIVVLDAAEGREHLLVSDPSDDLFPQWTPEGDRVLFASDRAGTFGLWRVDVTAGEATGEPHVVERDMGRMLPMGVTRDGSFYYFLKTDLVDVYTADFDPSTYRVTGTSRAVSPARVGSHTTSDWSHDGGSLAYVSMRSHVPTAAFSRALTIRDITSGVERDIWPALAFFVSPRWSPDGRSTLVFGLDLENRGGIHQIDLATGRVVPVVVRQPGIGEFEWSPDGRAILYRRGPATIVSRTVATGAETTVVDVRAFGADRLVAQPGPPPPLMLRSFQLSPDGHRLALTLWHGQGEETEATLAVLRLDSADLTRLHTASRLALHGWTADGNRLLFTMPTDGSPSRPSSALWWIGSTGGTPQPVGLERPGLSMVRISPDARRLTFTAGFDGGEVRVAERLLHR